MCIRDRLEDRPLDFIDDGIDLALRITDTPSPGLHGKPLMPVTHVICATEAYLQRHGMPHTPQELRAHSCISLGETPADARWKFRREGKTETVQTYGPVSYTHLDRTDAAQKDRAYRMLMNRKFSEEAATWMQEQRASAYVKILSN